MKILFICTHNRCRSILAEAITNHLSKSLGDYRIEARSAGSEPAGAVHPLSIKHLALNNIVTDRLQSQSWDDFQDWSPDVVITVCDSAANEQCPVWFGDSIRIHWGLKDPSKLAENSIDESTVTAAFNNTIDILTARISHLLSLPFESYDQQMLTRKLQDLEAINGAV